ncbi:MAG: DegT/DnrJ/EryC1/StrS family aminotransferase [Clostridia bacterium]|nr:DegT/DnrJ/EryC1/StrS family aminotransferase [Clostridia bacterium]
MNTPICDYIKKYNEENATRLHMPGHKGSSLLGLESYDITEIDGADCLYKANGIIKESEENASELFDSGATFYSCEGSSLSVRAMLYIAKAYALSKASAREPQKMYVLASRNAHTSFVSASVLLDFEVEWLYPDNANYISGKISAEKIEKALSCVDILPFAVYITSPDYLGNICNIKSIADVCKRYGIPLLVDNAHGAYLKFLKKSEHPIDQGATMCCDSAHKTLPVLTGGGYLHVSKDAPTFFKENARCALSLFGSSSPSYLILASLDNANKYINDGFSLRLADFSYVVDSLKNRLISYGYELVGDEKLKITIKAKSYGYTGYEIYDILRSRGIVCEFCDPDFIVMMLTIENKASDLDLIDATLKCIPQKSPILDTPPQILPIERVISSKEAYFSPRKIVHTNETVGKILSASVVTCPPAINIIVAGEKITQNVVDICKYYGIDSLSVIDD